jgi:hypothetical protein
MKITKPGIYPGIDEAAYYADPCPLPSLTQSICKVLLDQSPAHARIAHPRLAPPTAADDDEPAEKYDKAKAIGNAAHKLMIGRGKDIEVIDASDFRGAQAKAKRDAAVAAGKTPVLAHHFGEAVHIVEAGKKQLAVAGLADVFADGNGEVCVAAEDGIWMRALVDWMVSPVMLIDYKTTGASFAPHTIALKIESDGWDIQAAMQERILDLIDPENAGRRTFRFIAQENYEPYALVPVELTEHWLTMGRKKLAHAEKVWRWCMHHDVWPAYPLELLRPDYPQYREAAWLKREVEESERPLPRRREPMLTDLAGG